MNYILLFLIAGIILYKPFWGLCLYAFMIPLEDVLIITEKFTFLKFIGIFILIGWLLQFFISKQKLYISKPIKLSLFFIAWSFTSFLWASRPELSFNRWISIILLVGVFFLFSQIVITKKMLCYVILSNVLGSLISGGFGFYHFLLNPNQRIVAFSEYGQALSYYGMTLFLGIFYFLVISIFKSKKINIFSFLLFLMLLISAFSSGTRTFIVAFSVSILFLFWFFLKEKKSNKSIIKYFIVFFIVIVVINLVMPTLFFERASRILNLSDQWAGRTDIWKVYGATILDHPILGVGLENSWPFFGKYLRIAQSKYGISMVRSGMWHKEISDVHNIYILTWVELGIVGFILFLWIIKLLFNRIYMSLKKIETGTFEFWIGIIIILNFIAVLVMGIGEPILYRKYLWFSFSLVTIYNRVINSSFRNNKLENE